MRIEDLYPRAVGSADRAEAGERSGEADRGPAATHADSVSLSRLSQALFFSPARQARLEELRLLLEAGAYQVPAEEISRSLVEFYLDWDPESDPR